MKKWIQNNIRFIGIRCSMNNGYSVEKILKQLSQNLWSFMIPIIIQSHYLAMTCIVGVSIWIAPISTIHNTRTPFPLNTVCWSYTIWKTECTKWVCHLCSLPLMSGQCPIDLPILNTCRMLSTAPKYKISMKKRVKFTSHKKIIDDDFAHLFNHFSKTVTIIFRIFFLSGNA